MKIIYYYPEKDSNMYRWQRIHFINELAHHGIVIETFNPLVYSTWDEANDAVLSLIKGGHYELFMSGICNEHMLYIDTLENIKRYGLPTLSFRPDNLTIPFNDKKLAPHFDLLWLTSKETKPLYDKWKVKTCFAPYAANPYAFSYHPQAIIHRMCFIGTPYGSRARMINSFTCANVEMDLFYSKMPTRNKNVSSAEALKLTIYNRNILQEKLDLMRYKEGRILLYGQLMNRVLKRRSEDLKENEHLHSLPSIPVEELSIPYSSYALSLASTSNGHTDVLKNPLKIINLRNFEIPMAGGIEFCRYNPELAEYFEDGKEIIFYRSKEEMIEKALYYTKKASDEELKQMKIAARKRAESQHTWQNRFTTVFDALGLKY